MGLGTMDEIKRNPKLSTENDILLKFTQVVGSTIGVGGR